MLWRIILFCRLFFQIVVQKYKIKEFFKIWEIPKSLKNSYILGNLKNFVKIYDIDEHLEIVKKFQVKNKISKFEEKKNVN